jgi:hypothetical protein
LRRDVTVVADEDVVGEAKDPNGARVVLLDRVWKGKVRVDHPEMAPLLDEALGAVAAPDHAEPDPVRANRTRYYSRRGGPSEWLLVVVSYEQQPARIVSAFANRKDPPTWSE